MLQVGTKYLARLFLISLRQRCPSSCSGTTRYGRRVSFPRVERSFGIPIHNPGQFPRIPSSYRPVSITLFVAKLLESMINGRLTWFLDFRRPIPIAFGLRRQLCAFDCTLDCSSGLDHQHYTKQNTAALFLDIKKAYDDVCSLVMVCRLEELAVTVRARAFLCHFLYNRSIRLRPGRVLSESRILAKGLPQGFC